MHGIRVHIFDTDFHSLDFKERPIIGEDLNAKTKPIEIGAYVFVGANTIILKGVKIGDHSVVGAGSVVHVIFLLMSCGEGIQRDSFVI